MLLDATQTSLVSYTYDPYGETSASTVSDNTHEFSGRENDNPGNSQGLYYYRARYYMPGIVRFIAEDPIGWASGQTNNYAYVGGDPINFRDPTGFDAAPEPSGAGPSTDSGPTGPTKNPAPVPSPNNPAPIPPPINSGPTAAGKACRAACWGGGGAACTWMSIGCGMGEVLTIGGATIPCGVALAAVCGGGMSLCSDSCPP